MIVQQAEEPVKAVSKRTQQQQHMVAEDDEDWLLALAFIKPRHTVTIEGINCISQTWRMKERVSVFATVVVSVIVVNKHV